MTIKIETILQPFLKKELPDLRPGDTIRVYQKFLDYPLAKDTKVKGKDIPKGKRKSQIFEGLVIARKHGKEIGATITVRRIIAGIGVERTFPLHSPNIEKIEVIKRGKVRRAKLYYLREAKGKKTRLKKKEITKAIPEEGKIEEDIERTEEAKKENE